MTGSEWSSFIQSLLFALDLDTQGLAERCGMNPTTVTRWIEGNVYPRPGSRLRLYAAFDCASFEELNDRVATARRAKKLAKAQKVGEPAASDSELDELIRLIYLVMEPGPDRRALIEEIPFLSELRDDAAKCLHESFKPKARRLRENLEALESRES